MTSPNLISHEIILIMISMTILVPIKMSVVLMFVNQSLHIGIAIFSKSLITFFFLILLVKEDIRGKVDRFFRE